jgi:hypothetical protein
VLNKGRTKKKSHFLLMSAPFFFTRDGLGDRETESVSVIIIRWVTDLGDKVPDVGVTIAHGLVLARKSTLI